MVIPITWNAREAANGSTDIFAIAFVGGAAVGTGLLACAIFFVADLVWMRNRPGITIDLAKWSWASILGIVLGSGLSALVAIPIMVRVSQSRDSDPIVSWMAASASIAAIIGAVTGFAQWLVLRNHTKHSYFWPVISAVAWSVGAAAFWFAYGIADGPFFLPFWYFRPEPWPGWPVLERATALGWLTGGIIFAVLSGMTFRVLLAQSMGRVANPSWEKNHRS
jgi:hypothetical protein